MDGNVNLTDTVFSDQLEAIDKKYQFDAYVVGSDQVWLPSYYPSSFLSFVKRDNVKKVFYAASCGRISFIDRSQKYLGHVIDFVPVSAFHISRLKHARQDASWPRGPWQ